MHYGPIELYIRHPPGPPHSNCLWEVMPHASGTRAQSVLGHQGPQYGFQFREKTKEIAAKRIGGT